MFIQQNRSIRPRAVLTGVLITVLALACSAQAQNNAKPGPDGITVVNPQLKAQTADAVAPAKAAASSEASHGPQEGVKVHGHWVIDVKNPDGTLAQHSDFENSLSNANVMVALLYGSEVPVDFAILLNGSTSPCGVSSTVGYCAIVHNLSVLPASSVCGTYYCVTGLTVTPTFGSNPSLVLAGNLTATQAGSISTVDTMIGICGGIVATPTTASPSSCAAGTASPYGYSLLTGTSITAVPVVSGQIIQVTVTITFS